MFTKCLHITGYLLCTSKHRLCDTTKAKLVRSTPETFKGLGLSQQTAFCPQKALLAGMITLLFSLVFFESLHCLKRNIKQIFRTMEISCSKFNITHKKSKYLLLKNHNLLLLRNKSLQFHLYTVILIFPHI